MRLAIRSTLRALLVLGGLVAGVGAVARAQQGTVAGRVTDQASGQPLVGARITIGDLACHQFPRGRAVPDPQRPAGTGHGTGLVDRLRGRKSQLDGRAG